VLEREHKTHLVPALLLHHPSEQVVVQVLLLLTRSGRRAAVPTMNRIAEHPSPKVRAAVFAALAVLAPNPDQLRKRLNDEPSEEVRATLLVNLLVSGGTLTAEPQKQIDALLRHGTAPARVAFAEAVGHSRSPGFERALAALLQKSTEPEVRRASVQAMGNLASEALLPDIVGALGDEATRADAEHALINYGGSAMETLTQRFQDLGTAHHLRWRIPAAMALCSPKQALSTLIAWLPNEADGGVRFAILLVLERIVRQHPTLAVDRAALGQSVSETLTRAYRYLDARLNLQRGAAQDAARETIGYELLHALLRDKEGNARGRLFRLLGLLYPAEDFGQIYRSLTLSKEHRATSVELLENILREPVRSAVLGLVDDCADELRLTRAGRYHRVRPLGYSALLSQLAEGESSAVRELARHHAGELGLQLAAIPTGRAA